MRLTDALLSSRTAAGPCRLPVRTEQGAYRKGQVSTAKLARPSTQLRANGLGALRSHIFVYTFLVVTTQPRQAFA